MQMNMNVILVWAWMLWPAYAVEHERYYDLGMDALVSVCSRARTLSWFGAWLLWSSDAVEHERGDANVESELLTPLEQWGVAWSNRPWLGLMGCSLANPEQDATQGPPLPSP